MGHKNLALDLTWREHTKIIQAKLPDGHHLRFLSHHAILRLHLSRIGRSLVRMRTHTCENGSRIRLSQSQRRPAGSQIAAWINNARHTASKRGLDDSLPVDIKARGINVGVAINEQ